MSSNPLTVRALRKWSSQDCLIISRGIPILVNLLDGWTAVAARSAHATTRHAAFWHATATCCLVDLHHDWVDNAFQLLLFALELILLSKLVLVQPIKSFLHGLLNLVLVVAFELVLQLLFLEGVAHCKAIVLKTVFGLDLRLVLLILIAELLGLLHHAVDLSLRKTALLVRDSDLVGLTSRLVLRRHVENAIRINVEGDLDLWDST